MWLLSLTCQTSDLEIHYNGNFINFCKKKKKKKEDILCFLKKKGCFLSLVLPEEEVLSWSLSPSLLSSADADGPGQLELVARCCLRRRRDLCDLRIF